MASNNQNSGPPQGGRLAALITPRAIATPIRRGNNNETPSGRPSASVRRNNVATPHGRAAIRAMDLRRTALFTPGRARRRSLREQRETPRDILRNLSRILAPTSQIVSSSSSPESGDRSTDSVLPPLHEDDEDDDDFPIERPRFSLPLGPEEEDDDDAELKPPRLSGLEEDNYTMQSIELPRRAIQDNGLNRLDRSSFGSMRYSDYMGPDVQSDDFGFDSGFIPPPPLDDGEEVDIDEHDVIERMDADEARRYTLGAGSDFGAIEIPDTGNESTFMIAPIASPERDPTATEGISGLDDNMDSHMDDHMDDDDNGPLGGMDDDDDDDDHMNEPMDPPGFDTDEDNETNHPIENFGFDTSRVEERTRSHITSMAPRRTASKKRKAGKKISRHGIEYPSLPSSVVKRLATTLAKTAGFKGKISPDTLDEMMQASDWFFEQLGDSLSAYAKHAGRTTINDSDIITLMRRQRQTNATTTPFALAQRHLPRELLQELRMPVPIPSKAPRKKARRADVEGEEEVT